MRFRRPRWFDTFTFLTFTSKMSSTAALISILFASRATLNT